MTSDHRLLTGSWRSTIDPDRYVLIGISRSSPRGRSGYRRYPALMPGSWFRDPMSDEAWAALYQDEVLARLAPKNVLGDLMKLAGGRPAVLTCWEHEPPHVSWCHRALVSRWLQEQLGVEVPELGHEHLGCGCRHPKLPASLLQRALK